jgi:hypothetical protein
MEHGKVEIGAEILLRISREFGKRIGWLCRYPSVLIGPWRKFARRRELFKLLNHSEVQSALVVDIISGEH